MSDIRTLDTSTWGQSGTVAERNRVLRNTYWLLALSLVPTVLGAWLGVATGITASLGGGLVHVFGVDHLLELVDVDLFDVLLARGPLAGLEADDAADDLHDARADDGLVLHHQQPHPHDTCRHRTGWARRPRFMRGPGLPCSPGWHCGAGVDPQPSDADQTCRQ